jgi:hypothetical protein
MVLVDQRGCDARGHAAVAITLDLYSHVLPTMQREPMNALGRLHGS